MPEPELYAVQVGNAFLAVVIAVPAFSGVLSLSLRILGQTPTFGLLGQILILPSHVEHCRDCVAITHLLGNRASFLRALAPVLGVVDPLW